MGVVHNLTSIEEVLILTNSTEIRDIHDNDRLELFIQLRRLTGETLDDLVDRYGDLSVQGLRAEVDRQAGQLASGCVSRQRR